DDTMSGCSLESTPGSRKIKESRTMDRIDAPHLPRRSVPAEYPWMTGGMEILRRDFLRGDLKAVTAPAAITGTVVVEAARRIEGTIWLAQIAASEHLIRGVVGWAPLTDARIAVDLERLAHLP